ncbi:hypothetical protein [Bacillus sp. NPDC077027]|uniref:hypothetical protein n=1 Tax=Bacillus sp. NPDC077027 TaxID=3390548 RepID=UPI003D034E2C
MYGSNVKCFLKDLKYDVEYYLEKFSYYNWLKTSVEISGEDYINALWTSSKEATADDVITNSIIVVWLSNSLQSAIWGDRDLEICILATTSKSYFIKILSEEGWKPVNNILKEWLDLLFSDGEKFDEFLEELTGNYS